MKDLKVDVKLDHIFCHDEGDGPGSAEPYLWAVYFKVDGETVVVNTDGPAPPFLQGPPVVVGTPGDHANLGDTDVDEGDTIAIPAIIGVFHSTMTPSTTCWTDTKGSATVSPVSHVHTSVCSVTTTPS